MTTAAREAVNDSVWRQGSQKTSFRARPCNANGETMAVPVSDYFPASLPDVIWELWTLISLTVSWWQARSSSAEVRSMP